MKRSGRIFLSEVLRGEPVAFESTKTLDDHLERVPETDIVYEDEHTVAYVHRDADAGSDTAWALKVTVALRKHIPTLLDLDVCDQRSTGALLRAIQAVAYKFQLYDKGF